MPKRPAKPQATDGERRKKLASDLLGDLERLRGQLFAPAVERKALVVSDGRESGSHVEVVDVELTEPTFAAKRTIIEAIAVGLDKVLLLDKAVPSEKDEVDDLADLRAARRAGAKPVGAAVGGDVKRRGGGNPAR